MSSNTPKRIMRILEEEWAPVFVAKATDNQIPPGVHTNTLDVKPQSKSCNHDKAYIVAASSFDPRIAFDHHDAEQYDQQQ